jgi:REP element-mobilizing transposase RayT
MSRARRLHAPGCIVHLTARTHGRHPWFTESLRPRVNREISLASEASGHAVLARVVMPNHLHLIVKQGVAPLSNLMHRVMHRSAALLKWTHKIDGHVFERRYWSGGCLDAEYARTAIIYVHLNACRAGLCADPTGYEWSSHNQYLGSATSSEHERICAETGLRLFASDDDVEARRNVYLEHLRFQMSIDRFSAGEIAGTLLRSPRPCTSGDLHWLAEYAPSARALEWPEPAAALYDVASHLLRRLDPRCSLDLVRSGTRARQVANIRKQLIAALLARGFRGVALARFFGVSDTAISRIAVSLAT